MRTSERASERARATYLALLVEHRLRELHEFREALRVRRQIIDKIRDLDHAAASLREIRVVQVIRLGQLDHIGEQHRIARYSLHRHDQEIAHSAAVTLVEFHDTMRQRAQARVV